MGTTEQPRPDSDLESSLLQPASTKKPPEDAFHLAYIIYFTLGLGYLLPWNTFITAVDYFSYLYPDASVDRVFAVFSMFFGLFCLLSTAFYAYKFDAHVRINTGLGLFVVALLVVPVMDAVYIKGRVGLYGGFYVTVGTVALLGIGEGLVQGGLIGAAGELPERYMQAIVAGTAGSGVLVSMLRLFTKAIYPQDVHGLRKSANLYFSVGIVVMVVCIVLYNVVDRLPVIKYHQDLKLRAVNEEKQVNGSLTGAVWRSTVWHVVGRVKWYGFGIFIVYLVSLSIFPGYITEDVSSPVLKDWYGITLITCYDVFDLVGKSLTSAYLLENEKVAIGGSVVRLLFFPLFLGCMHGPEFFRTETPVTILTCLLGLSNGYLTSVLMILASKVVHVQHAKAAGIVIVLFSAMGLSSGSLVAWIWAI